MRVLAAGAVTFLLMLTGLEAASAATRPGSVGLVSFTAASYSRSTGTAGLTVDWYTASHARSYEVFISRHYSMDNAKRYTTTASAKTFTGLARGASYFVQVRARNGSAVGSKSARVGHTTIRRLDPAAGPRYRVMTYNVCSQKCSSWSTRQPAALARIAAYSPDVIAAQEAVNLAVPPATGYAEAVSKSSKRLLYKTSRFTVAEPTTPVPADPGENHVGCDRTWPKSTTGYVYLGYHDAGCRYAVWAVLVDRQTGQPTVFVDVHTVAGDNETRAEQREAEIKTLTSHLTTINPGGLPVVYAGDFNSHKNRDNDDMASVFHRLGYYDAFDLALKLYRQHHNSYNGFDVVPRISYKWGDHVDHVWIRPSEGRIERWANGALISNGRMVRPIPSDHSPIVVDVRLNR
ncbi:endonuclease/exonuclease/phosphatase family protein [Aeromicrobium sp. NPDC092404]|uniref:endonuclease/exonuclease/phosphatase family protein n=1 Tax=Aeromicrobium sp. NPDC092404 TaxID=3154976 RepID=UPI0034262170